MGDIKTNREDPLISRIFSSLLTARPVRHLTAPSVGFSTSVKIVSVVVFDNTNVSNERRNIYRCWHCVFVLLRCRSWRAKLQKINWGILLVRRVLDVHNQHSNLFYPMRIIYVWAWKITSLWMRKDGQITSESTTELFSSPIITLGYISNWPEVTRFCCV